MNKPSDPFAGLVLSEACTIREAMTAINENSREVVLASDGTGRIAGLITDGDIRRGLLKEATLEAPLSTVMRRDFFWAAPDLDRTSVLDIMKARMFAHVPVLDADRRLVAIHFLRDLIGAAPKPNFAVIMAGGRGTRLHPVTESIPKPMIEVAGRPMLERIILHLVGHGVHNIFLAVHYRAEMIEDYFGDGSAFGCRIQYIRETQPLGTGGALSLLPVRPSGPVIVLNGDLVTRINLTAMLDAHRKSGAVATIGVGPYQFDVPFAVVEANDGRVASIEEKPTMNLLVNRGIYLLEPAAIDMVPKDQEFPITSLFDNLLKERQHVGLYYFDDPWQDVGRPTDLRRANGLV